MGGSHAGIGLGKFWIAQNRGLIMTEGLIQGCRVTEPRQLASLQILPISLGVIRAAMDGLHGLPLALEIQEDVALQLIANAGKFVFAAFILKRCQMEGVASPNKF